MSDPWIPAEAPAPEHPSPTARSTPPVERPPAGQHRAGRRTPPRAHWVLLTFLLLALSAALFVQGYVHHEVGDASTAHAPGSAAGVPASIATGGPVIDARGAVPRSYRPHAGWIALTFDDGPDPTWTPKVLAVLRADHVPATFFLVGARVTENPGLVRAEHDAGEQIGEHTFTHADIGALPAWQENLELSQAQLAIAGAAGITTDLLRPPYSSTADSLDDEDWNGVRRAAGHGYVIVLATNDSEDWRRPGVARIIANATPSGHTGAIIMFHDAGGNRAQTVAALSRFIPEMKAKGYRFGTVSQVIGAPDPDHAASTSYRVRGELLLFGVRTSGWVLDCLYWAFLIAGGLTALRLVLLVLAARRHVKRRSRWREAEPFAPVSVIVPAYNEAAGIAATITSLAASDHPWLEVIVVDDGSTDDTHDIAVRTAAAFHTPRIRVLRQQNAGKAEALNTGIAHASHDLLVLLDGDTVFEPDTVRRLVWPLTDPRVGAVSGNAKVANRGGVLGRWQHIEYVVGFNLDRRLFDLAQCMPTVPGAVGAFRREALRRVGGVSSTTLAEDTDLTMALCRDGWRVVYEESARAWTEAPTSLRQLWRQRYRWCYGTLQAVWKHRGALAQRGQSGKLGRRGLVYLALFQFLLPLLAPAVDVYALYGLVFLNPVTIAAIWLGFIAAQMAAGWYAFRLDRERAGALWTLPLQQFVYRQLMYLVVIQSVVTALAGAVLRWHKLDRHGSARVAAVPATGGASPAAGSGGG
jgi:cellulose synthase/poly-beta-1,6-N-acetylglucosamine synthase-like glycosyltransferase/peptidoglycan/xylan/chitin deacetylase (PgdA/CDA1 family)